ncbi:NAD(P)/FAD-dependent oxidoreductase [Streptomyces sp. XM4193]|uniref:phytoene desaturase family protein n=1 Tax=Streptomyces sp. XM4193 TaxID=2929782 RepID=UPI001FF8C864|nr:NAD(P)/FAD-dependent oxidoreductase [Streptomyces sp. XM4193]MCK1796345.1 NAD(P)/FAD-dependent oxidoreductase [Streptomyces sp. XM4193]
MAEVVVVGAGMGAMAGAARLAVAGHRVQVHERADRHGGSVERYERDGFGFDTGPGLLQLPAVWRDLFVKTGRAPLESCVSVHQVDPASRHLFADGTEVTLPAASRAGVIDALDSALGAGSGERWTDLVSRARTVWDATRRPLLEEPRTVSGSARGLPDPYPAGRRGLFRRRTPTLDEVARTELRDPRLVALLGSYARGWGLDPRQTPASASVLAYLEQTFGSWYVVGGMQALADAVHARCLERKVTFHFNSEVVGLTSADGRATGVELADGSTVPADHVVDGTGRLSAGPAPLRAETAGPAPTTRDATAGPADAPAAGAGRGAPVPGHSRHTLLLALRGARPADTVHRTHVHSDTGVVTVSRPDDRTLVPDDAHEAVVVDVAVPAGSSPDAGAEAALLAAAERAVPDLTRRLLWHEARTPADCAERTGAPGGAVPVPALAGADERPLVPNLGSVRGSWALGGWAHPGGGLAHAGMSGALVAGLLVEGEDWRGSR